MNLYRAFLCSLLLGLFSCPYWLFSCFLLLSSLSLHHWGEETREKSRRERGALAKNRLKFGAMHYLKIAPPCRGAGRFSGLALRLRGSPS